MQASFSERIEHGGDHASDDRLSRKGRPLVVDVDEVLTQSDIRPAPLELPLAGGPRFDPSHAVFKQDAVTPLLRALGEGRPVFLCSERYTAAVVSAVAEHLGVSTAWSAVPGESKRETADLLPALRDGFDYIGPRRTALPTNVSGMAGSSVSSDVSTEPRADARTWLKLLRVHQYAKNALVLVPLLTAHKFMLGSFTTALLAAIAFSLCASGAYILNDLLDVKPDRAHPTKKTRPIASGAISPPQAIAAMIVVLLAALSIAASVSVEFAGVLLGYFALTTGYSLWLKRIAIVDAVVLATLYTIRVIGGAVAISVPMSEWLLAFSLLIFMSLALVKRYIELAGQPESGVLAARGYQTEDKSMIAILAAASGLNAVVIFTLYISSDTVRALYSHPQLLWIGCPILMYWIGRVMLFAQRGLIDDDPVIFALRDRVSWCALCAIGVIMLAAI